MKIITSVILFLNFLIISNSYALIEVDITEGNRDPLPIAVTGFFL